MFKKGCELCSKPATMLCESDQATLCWDCDEKVHSVNFLVAKHSRTLLCHVCYSPTAWKSAGLKLGRTVSICHGCAELGESRSAPVERGQGVCRNSQESESDDGKYLSDTDTDSDDYTEDEEEEDGENQVVPWAAATSSLKRIRGDPFESEDGDGDRCCSSQNSDSKLCAASDQLSLQLRSEEYKDSSSSSLLRPLKMRRTSNHNPSTLTEQVADQPQMKSLKGTAAIVDKLLRLHQEIATGEGEEEYSIN